MASCILLNLKEKINSTWNGEDPYSNLFKRSPSFSKKKKKLEIKCELKLDRYTYYHIHEIDIKDHGINPSTYIEIKREKRKEIKKR